MVDLYINGKNALTEFGAWLGEDGLTTLLTPPPMKSYLENKSAVSNGKQVLINEDTPALADERNLKLIFYIKGDNTKNLMYNYNEFVSELTKGKVDISTSFQNGVIYHLTYQSASEPRTALKHGIKLIVNFNEPNPANRE